MAFLPTLRLTKLVASAKPRPSRNYLHDREVIGILGTTTQPRHELLAAGLLVLASKGDPSDTHSATIVSVVPTSRLLGYYVHLPPSYWPQSLQNAIFYVTPH